MQYYRKRGVTPRLRFYDKVSVQVNGCHLWTAGTNGKAGYGQFYLDTKKQRELAHRVAWYFEYGAWPSKELDHLCRNRLCVNVKHLEEVDHKENLARRPDTLTHRKSNPTLCVAGLHAWVPENLRKGRQECRLCYNTQKKARYHNGK